MRIHVIPLDKLCRESWESQSAAGRHNPATVAKFHGRRHVLPVGETDWMELYWADEDRERCYCVSINRRYGYCGVQAYDPDDQEAREELSIFHQCPEECEDFGPKWDDLADRTIARRLIAELGELCC